MKIVVFWGVAILFLSSCDSSIKLRKQIKIQENALMESAQKGKTDTSIVNNLLKAYEKYAENYPEDTMSANYLFKAADFNRYMHKPLQSIRLYNKIYESFPKIEKRPYALFLQGFIYENEVSNMQAARSIYIKFLKEYPSHPISKDVQITLKNLGKSPEQIVEEFIAREQADSMTER